jgi:hypothetical protein
VQYEVQSLLSPFWIAASIPDRCSVIVRASLMNGCRRDRLAQASQASSSAIAWSNGTR